MTSGLELTLLHTNDLAEYSAALRWASILIGIIVLSVLAFVWVYFGTGRKWLGVTAVTMACLAEFANTVSPLRAIRHAVAIYQIRILVGALFTLRMIMGGPWTMVEIVGVALAVAHILDASIKLWKDGGRRRAVIVGGGIIFFFRASRGR